MKYYSFYLKALCAIWMSIAFSVVAHAQFDSAGDDPARLKWYSTETPSYRIIYPEGTDSLARVYGAWTERFKISESISSGLTPGEGYRRKTPLILHTCHGISNGAVTWAPKRADLYTLQDAYDPEPMPWVKNLSVHESRHLAQMQFGYKGWMKPFTWLLGDMSVGAWSAIWPSNWLLEGDAVTAETALTKYGRGRSADFLDYYMMAFDRGDWRNWYRWRYGSYKHEAPDHYALGYLTVAGTRYCFDDPLFTQRYFQRIATNPFRFFNTQKTIKMASGMSFKKSFSTIMDEFHDIWTEDAEKREPFTQTQAIQVPKRWFSKSYGNTFCNGSLYAIVSGNAETYYLAKYNPEDGKFHRIRPFSSITSRLESHGDLLFWSESIPDERWSLEMASVIRSFDTRTGKIRNLTRKGRLFNPAVSPDGRTIAAVEYPIKGGSAIVLVNADDGKIERRLAMPDSLQAAEVCFLGEDIAFSTISESGSGIFLTDKNLQSDIRCISEPLPISIRNLVNDRGVLYFTSDRDGTQELYSINDGVIRQHTSLKYGGNEFCMNGDSLYFTVLQPEGRLLHTAPLDDGKAVDFKTIHKYKVAEALTRQEKNLAEAKGVSWVDGDSLAEPDFSKPKRYYKHLHILRFHSWAPIYFNYDNVRNLSGEFNYETASVGATALFQNDLGTAFGSIGYSWHKDPYSYAYGKTHYRNSGHILFTYSGLYPIFEISADFGDMAAVTFGRQIITKDGKTSESLMGTLSDKASARGNFRVYVPFNLSSGGWRRGLIPQIEYNVSNDVFDKTITKVLYEKNEQGKYVGKITGTIQGERYTMQTVKASLRGYSLLPVPKSGVYPRFGIGAEAGYYTRVGIADIYSPSAYGYIYGYLPGITATQGLRLAVKAQHQQGSASRRENSITMTPRGFDDSGSEYFIRNVSDSHLLLSADYVIPVWVGDISWFSPLFYIKNFEVTPHLDYGFYKSRIGSENFSLFSAGADITAHLANFLWIPYDCRIGFTFDMNGGKSFDKMKSGGYVSDNHHFGFIFSISL